MLLSDTLDGVLNCSGVIHSKSRWDTQVYNVQAIPCVNGEHSTVFLYFGLAMHMKVILSAPVIDPK